MRLRTGYRRRSRASPLRSLPPTKSCAKLGMVVLLPLPRTDGIDRHFAPAEHLELFALDDLFDVRHRLAGLVRVLRQEGHAGAVVARRREVEVDDRAEEAIGHLDQDAGAVAGPLVGAEGAAMVEVAQRRQTELDDAVAATATKVGHEADAARVVLEPRVVESLSLSVETHQSPREWYTDIIGPGEVDANADSAG